MIDFVPNSVLNLEIPDSTSHWKQFNSRAPFAFADYGKRLWTVLVNNHACSITTKDFVSLDWMSDCKQLVSEHSHIQQPQTERSFAQPLRPEMIARLYDNAIQKKIGIWVVSHHQMRTVRALTGSRVNKKFGDDELDCRCWHTFICENAVSMHRLKRTYKPDAKREAIYEFKDQTNQILNCARTFKYEMSGEVLKILGFPFDYDACLELIELAGLQQCKPSKISIFRNSICYDMDPEIRKAVYSFTEPQTYALASMIVSPFTQKRRIRIDTKMPPGSHWLMRNIVGNTPFHHRGGIARSNIYYHGVANFASQSKKKWEDMSKAEVDNARLKRRNYIKAVRRTLQHLIKHADKVAKPNTLF